MACLPARPERLIGRGLAAALGSSQSPPGSDKGLWSAGPAASLQLGPLGLAKAAGALPLVWLYTLHAQGGWPPLRLCRLDQSACTTASTTSTAASTASTAATAAATAASTAHPAEPPCPHDRWSRSERTSTGSEPPCHWLGPSRTLPPCHRVGPSRTLAATLDASSHLALGHAVAQRVPPSAAAARLSSASATAPGGLPRRCLAHSRRPGPQPRLWARLPWARRGLPACRGPGPVGPPRPVQH